MTYVLHNRLGSGGFAVEAVLALAGLAYDYRVLASKPDTPLGPEIRPLNPWGQVPVLQTPDGEVITETAAIIAYLAEHEPACRQGPHLWAERRAALLRWSVFLAVNVYEGLLRRSYPDRYCEGLPDGDPDAAPLTALMSTAINTATRTRIARQAHRRVHDAFAVIEATIAEGEFLLGPRLSPCDVFLAMLYAWHNRQPDLPRCTDITQRVATHDIVNGIWERNFHDRLDEKWHARRPLWA